MNLYFFIMLYLIVSTPGRDEKENRLIFLTLKNLFCEDKYFNFLSPN